MKNSPDQSAISITTESNFGADVLESRVPVLLIFWTSWSSSCRIIEPVLEEISASWAGRAKVVKIDADDSPDLSFLYDVQSIPTLIYFIQGEPRVRIVGTASKDAILAKLKSFGAPQENNPLTS